MEKEFKYISRSFEDGQYSVQARIREELKSVINGAVVNDSQERAVQALGFDINSITKREKSIRLYLRRLTTTYVYLDEHIIDDFIKMLKNAANGYGIDEHTAQKISIATEDKVRFVEKYAINPELNLRLINDFDNSGVPVNQSDLQSSFIKNLPPEMLVKSYVLCHLGGYGVSNFRGGSLKVGCNLIRKKTIENFIEKIEEVVNEARNAIKLESTAPEQAE